VFSGGQRQQHRSEQAAPSHVQQGRATAVCSDFDEGFQPCPGKPDFPAPDWLPVPLTGATTLAAAKALQARAKQLTLHCPSPPNPQTPSPALPPETFFFGACTP